MHGHVASGFEVYAALSLKRVHGHVASDFKIYAPLSPNVKYEDVPVVEFMHLVFTRTPSATRRLRSLLLCLWDNFRALINSLVS